MSSESASSATETKIVKFRLNNGLLCIDGIEKETFAINCSNPKLNLKQLYEAVFADVEKPTTMLVSADDEVKEDSVASGCYESVKKVIEAASREVNEELPAVLEKRKIIVESMASSSAEGDSSAESEEDTANASEEDTANLGE